MTDRGTKRKSRRPLATRVVLAIVVLLGVLATGRLVLTGSVFAGGAPETPEAQIGEALMEMDMRATSAGGPAQVTGPGWYTCDLHRVGPGWANVYLSLSSSGNWGQRWFKAREDQEKEILAAGLTALSGSKKLSVYVSGTGPSPYGEIRACYVLK